MFVCALARIVQYCAALYPTNHDGTAFGVGGKMVARHDAPAA